MVDIPDPAYMKTSDGTYIAYQVFGDGPIDIGWQFDIYGTIDSSLGRPLREDLVERPRRVRPRDPA